MVKIVAIWSALLVLFALPAYSGNFAGVHWDYSIGPEKIRQDSKIKSRSMYSATSMELGYAHNNESGGTEITLGLISRHPHSTFPYGSQFNVGHLQTLFLSYRAIRRIDASYEMEIILTPVLENAYSNDELEFYRDQNISGGSLLRKFVNEKLHFGTGIFWSRAFGSGFMLPVGELIYSDQGRNISAYALLPFVAWAGKSFYDVDFRILAVKQGGEYWTGEIYRKTGRHSDTWLQHSSITLGPSATFKLRGDIYLYTRMGIDFGGKFDSIAEDGTKEERNIKPLWIIQWSITYGIPPDPSKVVPTIGWR